MAKASAKEVYERYVRSLPTAERLQLLVIVAQDLVSQGPPVEHPKRSIMELHGLGKEIWEGVEAEEYVNRLRGEWDSEIVPDEA